MPDVRCQVSESCVESRRALLSFAYYDVDEGAFIHEHWHEDEEVWHIIEGTLEVTIDGETLVAGKGSAAPADSPRKRKLEL